MQRSQEQKIKKYVKKKKNEILHAKDIELH